MELTKKIYFVSDVHLGAPALTNNRKRELLFVKWLNEIKEDASHLFLLGDIFDFWFEYKKVVPRGFTRTLGKIAELVEAGIEVHLFTGNHDVWVFDYLPEEIGVIVHREEFKVTLHGKQFFLAHGDGLDVTDKGYIFLKKIFTNKFLQWCFARLHPNFAFGFAHKWSKHSRLSKGIVGKPFIGEEEELFKFSKNIQQKEKFNYYIFGHRHLLVNMPIEKDSDFILLGEWIRLFSFGVFDGEKFELKKYEVEQPLNVVK